MSSKLSAVDAELLDAEISPRALDKSLSKVESAVLSVLEQTPPELYADIVSRGIYLAGGGALLRGLDKRLTKKINIPFHVAEDPLHAVARGTGIILENVDKFEDILIEKEEDIAPKR